MTPEIILSEKDETEFSKFLKAHIREFNNLTSAAHRAVRLPGAVQPLNLMLMDESDQWVGGLSGSTYWDWFEIDDFFIPAALRGKGIGRALLQAAEAAALERGAKHCFLTTYSFQARYFYEKQGYYVTGKLEDYPPGSTYFWMRKDLA